MTNLTLPTPTLHRPAAPDVLPLALLDRLIIIGYRVGLPPSVIARTFLADAHGYRKHRCPDCGGRQCVAVPLTRAETYKIILACPCGGQTEV